MRALARRAALLLRAADLQRQVALVELQLGLGHLGDLVLRLPALPEEERGVTCGYSLCSGDDSIRVMLLHGKDP